jgi:hypothetical protein
MAYLDPGSGSYLIQILIAFLLGSAIAIRAFWGRIKAFFVRVFSRKSIEEEDE